MKPKKILIIEDFPPRRQHLTELVQSIGFHACTVQKKTELLDSLHLQNPDLVLLSSHNNTGQVNAISKAFERKKNGIPFVVIGDGESLSKHQRIHSDGNFAALPSTFKPKDLKLAIIKLLSNSDGSRDQQLKDMIIGASPKMLRVKEYMRRLSTSDVTVLITGESGTGKELVARAIHNLSPRADKPFIKVNSAALPTNLLESELFGFEKGAFTGAWQQKPGKFKLAHSGSLLLDEIGEIPLPLQAKLLQVLQDNELTALGSTTSTKVDVRVFAVTNANLIRMVAEGGFRSDLYYRLNVVPLKLPALRERKEDLGLLIDHFLEKYAVRYGREKVRLQDRTLELFYQYAWPGNIRELENILQSIAVLRNEEAFWEKLKTCNLPRAKRSEAKDGTTNWSSIPFVPRSINNRNLKEVSHEAVRKAETEAILDVLCHTRWNRRNAARLLKISYKALLNKIKEYEIVEQYRSMIRKDGVFNEHEQSKLS